MMFHPQGTARNTCCLLAVTCGNSLQEKYNRDVLEDQLRFPFPELVSSGRLEVKILTNPSKNEICKVVDSYQPNILYLQGERLENDEVGSLVLADVDLSSVEAIHDLFRTTLPTTVYLEIPNGDQLAEALHSKGIPYVIYWKNSFSRYTSCHFRNAFLSVVQSSSTHIWDAFQLGLASFRIYCVPSSHDRSDRLSEELEPHLLGEPSKINVEPPEMEVGEDEEGSPPQLPTINIHNDDVTTRFLICGESSAVDERLLGSLEDGLSALLNIEIRGGKLHGKFSAPPPPLQAGTFSRGVVTMRCDLSTSSAAHISLLVSGSAQTCFDDQLLENHIKNEIIENALLVRSILDNDGNKVPLSEPRKSESIACGATVFEISMKVPSWALQVLRQLAPDATYRSLVALGIASVQGLTVASFEKEDAERLLFFCSSHEKEIALDDFRFSSPPSWLKPPVPSKKRCQPSNGKIIGLFDSPAYESILPTCKIKEENQDGSATNGFKTSALPARQRVRVAALRPIPRRHRHKITPFSGITEANGQNGGQIKANMLVVPSTKQVAASAAQRKTFSNLSQSKQIISLNPLPLKKHGCDRSSIHTCCEENFLKDVMEFLILRGHNRLIPQGGFAEFPEAILNGKRLDLYNLYKEVVTRGGFHVGNGINWKGQIFSKMRNYTMTNRMTGVGNTLKRHYETYLLEYELAHDDVDGECCLLCHSSAAGDWVNCGICGEWAHFGCDRRQGLGAFKDYAKTDGLEYICPHCSVTNFKRKSQKTVNGYSQG